MKPTTRPTRGLAIRYSNLPSEMWPSATSAIACLRARPPTLCFRGVENRVVRVLFALQSTVPKAADLGASRAPRAFANPFSSSCGPYTWPRTPYAVAFGRSRPETLTICRVKTSHLGVYPRCRYRLSPQRRRQPGRPAWRSRCSTRSAGAGTPVARPRRLARYVRRRAAPRTRRTRGAARCQRRRRQRRPTPQLGRLPRAL